MYIILKKVDIFLSVLAVQTAALHLNGHWIH